MQTLQFFGDTDRNDREKKTGKGGKENGNLTRISFGTHGRRRRSTGRHAACGWRGSLQRSCCCRCAITAILENGEKQSEDCPAKPGGGHSGQYPGSAAHAGRYGSLRGRQRRRYGRGRQWSGTMRRLSRWNSSAPPGRQRGPISVKAYDSQRDPSAQLWAGGSELLFGCGLAGRQPDRGLLRLQHQPGRGAHLRLYRCGPGCHREPQRGQEQRARLRRWQWMC